MVESCLNSKPLAVEVDEECDYSPTSAGGEVPGPMGPTPKDLERAVSSLKKRKVVAMEGKLGGHLHLKA